MSGHPKIQVGISDTPNILVYLMTSSSVNLFNTAITTHQKLSFHLTTHRNRLAAGLCPDPLGELTALP